MKYAQNQVAFSCYNCGQSNHLARNYRSNNLNSIILKALQRYFENLKAYKQNEQSKKKKIYHPQAQRIANKEISDNKKASDESSSKSKTSEKKLRWITKGKEKAQDSLVVQTTLKA